MKEETVPRSFAEKACIDPLENRVVYDALLVVGHKISIDSRLVSEFGSDEWRWWWETCVFYYPKNSRSPRVSIEFGTPGTSWVSMVAELMAELGRHVVGSIGDPPKVVGRYGVCLSRKGRFVKRQDAPDLVRAMMMLPSMMISDSPLQTEEEATAERMLCNHPGCSSRGVWIMERGYARCYRIFCDAHRNRGNVLGDDANEYYRHAFRIVP